jgi:Concanavalin A-like lectin/glucanases superfamily/Domain of unknown function (DUF2341)
MYSFTRAITIDHTKVVGSDQTNFPMLFAGTYSYLATVANGGNVTSSSGFDIIFTSDRAGTSPLAFEIDTYDPATGTVAFWVRIPTLSHTVQTTIFIQYGDPSVTTSQENKPTLWAAFAGVWHANLGAGNVVDSSANANNMGPIFAGGSNVTGKIGKAINFPAGSSGAFVKSPAAGVPTGNAARTLSCWFQITGPNTTQYAFFGWGSSNAGQRWQVYYDSNRLLQDVGGNGDAFSFAFDSNWHQLVTTLPASGNLNQALMYLDGVAQSVTLQSATVNTDASPQVRVGNLIFGSNLFPLVGSVDEMRILGSVLSADWIATEYNNQNSPATFYSIGSAPAGAEPIQCFLLP